MCGLWHPSQSPLEPQSHFPDKELGSQVRGTHTSQRWQKWNPNSGLTCHSLMTHRTDRFSLMVPNARDPDVQWHCLMSYKHLRSEEPNRVVG